MRLSLVHPTGNPFARNAALGLSELNLLHEIVTTLAYNPQGKIGSTLQFFPQKLHQAIANELGRRTWIAPEGVKMQSYPWREILRVLLMRTGFNRFLGLETQPLTDWIYESVDRQVAKAHLQGLTAVYAYEDGAATTFTIAKQLGIRCLYDLPIPFYTFNQKIQQEEAQQFPELSSALQAIQEPEEKLKRKQQEVDLADHIFVASSVTQNSLLDIGVSPSKISVIPYGAPLEYFTPQPKPDRKFRALFVGRVGPRKGVHYLLQAWKNLQLPNAELLLVGINEFPQQWLAKYRDIFRYIPSVPHSSLNQYYSAASVFVFPSLVEGFGLVLLEAMACGIPVIASINTAAPDIITDGVEGFIIPIKNPEILQDKIEWCYRNPKTLAEMGRAARRKAQQLTWSLYRQTLAMEVQSLLIE